MIRIKAINAILGVEILTASVEFQSLLLHGGKFLSVREKASRSKIEAP